MTSSQWHGLTKEETTYWEAQLARAEERILAIKAERYANDPRPESLEQQVKSAGKTGNFAEVEAALRLIEARQTKDHRLDQEREDLEDRIIVIRTKLKVG